MSGTRLPGVDLTNANLSAVFFREADLSFAILTVAILNGAAILSRSTTCPNGQIYGSGGNC